MAFPNRVDVVAYNLNQKKFEWKHENLTPTGNSNHQQIFIHLDFAYFAGGSIYYCLDLKSGEILWQYTHPTEVNGFLLYKPTYVENDKSIIVQDAGFMLFSLNAENGSVKWINKEDKGGHAAGSPQLYNGIIYYVADASLCDVRASNGNLLWKERPYKNGSQLFQGDITIDPGRGVLYATDKKHLYCIRLYED
ncbi:MAG: PQQ-like beta-propeller repeat protein [Saprospiraceae bacterium]|nr:PQQ-like beta-propeller repeat protein [Saprospiraceae bacterium]